jgi:hypothetical protein
MATKDYDEGSYAPGVEPPPADDGSLAVNDYQSPGIHIDAQGKQHTAAPGPINIPDNDPLVVPKSKPGFYRYFEKVDYVPLAISRGFRPVTRREAGFETVAGLPAEYGLDAGDVPHRIHDLVLMEAPQAVYDAIDAERQRTARAAIEPILRTATKVEVEEASTGNRVEDWKEASITASRIRDIKSSKE